MNSRITLQVKYAVLMCRKHLFVFSFGFIALIGLYNTSLYGLASLNFYVVKNTLSSWQSDRSTLTEQSYDKAKAEISQARERHPSHPLYFELSAEIYEWGAITGYENKSIALKQAKRLYMKAAGMRPTWPVTYASLAMNKWRSNEFDQELINYLRLADKYGPKKAEVNILFVEMGLALYQSNHPFYAHLRPTLKQRLSQGARNAQSRERVIAAIQRHKAKRTVCRWLGDSDEYVSTSILNCETS